MSRFTFMTINFLLFHTCWMATAYGAGYGWYWLGPLFIVPALVLHLSLLGDWVREFTYLLTATLLGYAMNTMLMNLGIISYSSTGLIANFPPTWMIFLWMIFSSLFHGSLQWLRGRYFTEVILGLLLGPFAYVSAEALNALAIGSPYYGSLLVISFAWAVIFPVLSWLAFEVEVFSEIGQDEPKPVRKALEF